MELLQTVIVIESLVLAAVLGMVALWFYSRSHRIMDLRVFGLLVVIWFYCMPGILGAFSPLVLRIVIPLQPTRVMLPVALSLPLLAFSILAGLLIRWGPRKRLSLKSQWKLARQISLRYRLGRLFLYSAVCLAVAFFGVWKGLHAAGGWLAVVRGGGEAYLEARGVHSLGIWGLLISFFPVAAIGLMYCAVHGRVVSRGLRMPLAAGIFAASTGIVALLTARHLIVMLLLAMVALLEIKSKALFRLVVPILLVLIAVGAFALSTFRYSSRVQNIDKLTGNFEHIRVAERITATVKASGYIWGGNVPDLFTFLIPRAVWPNKPMGNRITRSVFFEYAKQGGVKVPGIVGEAYASWGLLGVVLEGFLYGILLRRLAAYWARRHENTLLFATVGALIIGFTYMAVRQAFFGPHDFTFITILIQIWFMNRLCGYPREKMAPESALEMPQLTRPLAST